MRNDLQKRSLEVGCSTFSENEILNPVNYTMHLSDAINGIQSTEDMYTSEDQASVGSARV